VERVLQALDAQGGGIDMTFVRSFHDHPAFVTFLAERLAETLAGLTQDERDGATVLFTAHSLPVRTADDGSLRCTTCDCADSCRYRDGLQRTGDLVAELVGVQDHRIAWQSVGRTADPWWGPGIDEMIPELVAEGRRAVVVCCAGFVADHLETLYDLDIEAARDAHDAGIVFARTRMPNADPAFCDVLATVVREHLAGVPG
jgi:ferrochelatase